MIYATGYVKKADLSGGVRFSMRSVLLEALRLQKLETTGVSWKQR